MCQRQSVQPISPSTTPTSCCRHADKRRAHRAVAVEEAEDAHDLHAAPRVLRQVEDHLRLRGADWRRGRARCSALYMRGRRAALQACSAAACKLSPGSAAEVHCTCWRPCGNFIIGIHGCKQTRACTPSSVWPRWCQGAALGRACVSFHQCMLSRLYWLVPLKYLQAAGPQLHGALYPLIAVSIWRPSQGPHLAQTAQRDLTTSVRPKSCITAHRHRQNRRPLVNNHVAVVSPYMRVFPERRQQTSAMTQGRSYKFFVLSQADCRTRGGHPVQSACRLSSQTRRVPETHALHEVILYIQTPLQLHHCPNMPAWFEYVAAN